MRRPAFVLLALLSLVAACGGSRTAPNAGAGGGDGDGDGDGDGKVVSEWDEVIVEKQPDGSTKKTTIHHTKKLTPAAPPPPRPADPWPSDPLVKYNVDRVNAYRAKKGLPALLYDAKISAFAREGSEQLARDHAPHAHFRERVDGAPGFGSRSAENQGDPSGVPSLDPDASANGRKQVDVMMKLMFDEGPGGGHYENMVNSKFRRIGVGLVYVGGKLYLTNDFSD